jgi:hypothetical protein
VAAQARATIWLCDDAKAAFEVVGHGAFPLVVAFCRELQVRASEELAQLPESSAITEMLAFYAVM